MPERTSIYLSGFGHENPIPVASRMGPFLFSGVLSGRDPATREMPRALDEQILHVFAHARELLRVAGGSPEHIAKMTFWVAAYRDREALNRQWLDMFPDPANRPARQVMAAMLDGGSLVQADLVAVLPDTPPPP